MKKLCINSCLHLRLNKSLMPNQHGVLPNRFNETLLRSFTDRWRKAIYTRQYVGLVLLNLKKAFGTVDHFKLMGKLSPIGVRNKKLECFGSFLSGRSQRTKWQCSMSMPDPVRCGMPQRSVLGPFLLLVFINDLLKLFLLMNCIVECYAYGTSTYVCSKNLDT